MDHVLRHSVEPNLHLVDNGGDISGQIVANDPPTKVAFFGFGKWDPGW